MDAASSKMVSVLEGRTSPCYTKVRDWLLGHISTEQLGPGDRIPSERVLADALKLSRPTIARAVAELVERGVLMREQRSGTFVGKRAEPTRQLNVRTIGIMMPWVTQDDDGKITASVSHDIIHLPHRRESMHLEIMHGALSVLNQHGCRFLILANNDIQDGTQVLGRLSEEKLDGLLAIPQDAFANELLYEATQNTGTALVFIDRYCPNVKADRVVTDNLSGAKAAVKSLIDKGHRRIAMFTDFGAATSVQERQQGYREALEEAGLQYDEDIVCGPQIARFGWWRLDFALEHCRSLPQPVTAVFCMNDTSVLATLDAAIGLGVSIPHDLEVAGFFDDHVTHEIGAHFTRVRQDTRRMGRIAAEMLMERISGTAPDELRHIVIPAQLIPAEE